MSIRYIYLLGSSALSVALMCPSAAIAQSESGTPAAGGEVRAEEIVVTAQKRAESIQRVPAAITAFSADMIESRGIREPTDLRLVVPGLQAGTLLGQTNIIIRGVGLNLVTSGQPGVAIHLDGVYQPVAAMGDLGQIDIERVEVLRGPQGTLYGRNANGGAVNFITKAPTSDFEGYAQVGYATYSEAHMQGMLNVPLGDMVAIRGVIDYSDRRDPFIKNVIAGQEGFNKGSKLNGRVRLRIEPSDAITNDTSIQISQARGPLYSFVLRDFPNAAALVGNPVLANAIVPTEKFRTSVDNAPILKRDFTYLANTLSVELGDVSLKSITGWQRLKDSFAGDEDGFNLPFLEVQRKFKERVFTQELNLSAKVGPLDAVVGGFYMKQNSYASIFYSFPLGFRPLAAGSNLVYTQPNQKTTALAAFFDGTLNVSDRFRLLGGIRFSHDKIAATQQNYTIASAGAAPVYSCPLQTNSVEFNSTTPRFGAQYDVSGSSNLFATFSKGFKDGGFNRTQCNRSYQPEEITAYEVGTKNVLADNRLTLNASAFYYRYKNLQLVQVFGLTNGVSNAAAAEIKGFELESNWRVDRHLTLSGNLSLLDARYTSFQNTDTLNPTAGVQDVSGNRLSNAPKHTLNMGFVYDTGPLGLGNLQFRADVGHRSKIYFREFNTPDDAQGAIVVVNAGVTWTAPDEKVEIRLWGNNIFNEGFYTAAYANSNFGSYQTSWNNPAQFGADLKVKF